MKQRNILDDCIAPTLPSVLDVTSSVFIEGIENICESLEIKGLSPSDNLESITLDTDFDNTRIAEDALYDLILESKAKNARRFRKWITVEVLLYRYW